MVIQKRVIKNFADLFEEHKEILPKEFIEEFCNILQDDNFRFNPDRFKTNFYTK